MANDPAFSGLERVTVAAAAAGLAAAAPMWLLVTEIEWKPGDTFTAIRLDAGPTGSRTQGPRAFGGDVLIGLGTAPPPEGAGPATITVTVHAAVAGRLVRLATVKPAAATDWPEQVRLVISVAMEILTCLGEHADLCGTVPVSLGDPPA
jgi:hypothetical protein